MNDDDNVVDLMSRKASIPLVPQATDYEIHLYPSVDGEKPSDIQVIRGFLKFGPQFIAVLEGPTDTDPVVFVVSSPMVKFVKKIDKDGTVQGTLSL